MSDLFGNHIVGFPTRWLISLNRYVNVLRQLTEPVVTCGNEVPSLYDNLDTSDVMSLSVTSVTAGADLKHQENMSVKCIPPQTPLLYSKTGVCRGIPIFLIFAPKT